MNVGDYGVAIVVSTGYDMVVFTELSLNFTKPDGSTLVVYDPDVTVPIVDVMTTEGLFVGRKYAQYFFKDGDVDQDGDWTVRVIYKNDNVNPPLQLISNTAKFTVRK